MELKSINKNDFLKYINTYWTNKSDKVFIDMYTNSYSSLGKGIGLYNKDILIGFIFYKEDIKKPMWIAKTQEHKPDLINPKYDRFWDYYLLEIHPDYRLNGFGSMLLQEVYKMMPVNCVLVGMSERTDNHIKFYEKNEFIQNKTYKNSQYYLFFRIK